jgi:uncharacterized protein (TIGR03084 family)
VSPSRDEVVEDLAAEQQALDAILSGLDERGWLTESGAAGWTIADVVLHLAQSEEAVVDTLQSGRPGLRAGSELTDAPSSPLDELMDRRVRSERGDPAVVFARWREARLAALAALRGADEARAVPWAAAPLRPATLATTRLAEHWAHALDVVAPLGVGYPDTARLRHIAWLAHRTLPYAFRLAGQPPADVYCELGAPDGLASWTFGDPAAPSRIRGSAGEFCRVATRRLTPEATRLAADGPRATDALRVLRTYAT